MKAKKLFLTFLLSILTVGVLAACGGGEEASGKKKLTMATSADYPPYEFIDTEKGEEIIGFDVDIAKYITNKLGYELEIVDMDFTTLITAMNAGKADFILAGMTPDEERLKNADFSDIYFTAKHLVVSKKESGINSIEDLEGKKIGVQTGSIQEGVAEIIEEQVNVTVETRNRIPELIQELLAGRFDGAIIEDTVAAGHFKNNPDLVGFEVVEAGEGGSAIAFPKDSELTDEFNKVLNEMMENGELEKLVIKWFGGEE